MPTNTAADICFVFQVLVNDAPAMNGTYPITVTVYAQTEALARVAAALHLDDGETVGKVLESV